MYIAFIGPFLGQIRLLLVLQKYKHLKLLKKDPF